MQHGLGLHEFETLGARTWLLLISPHVGRHVAEIQVSGESTHQGKAIPKHTLDLGKQRP